MFKVKLTFHGPNTVATVTKTEPLRIGHAISFETELLFDVMKMEDVKQFWEMERTFNEKTKGRLHVEIIEVANNTVIL